MSDLNAQQMKQVNGCVGCFAIIGIMIGVLLFGVWLSDSRRAARIDREMKGTPAVSLLPGQLLMDSTGQYNDKVVQVRGVVIDKYADAVGVIVFLGSGVGKEGIYCNFRPEWWTNVSKWSKGDRMNVRGVVSSGFGTPTMRECRIDPVD